MSKETSIKNPSNLFKLVIIGLIIGLFSGIIVSIYRFLLVSSESFLYNNLKIIQGDNYLIGLWFCILLILGLITGFIVKKEPMSSGSGIPQVKAEIKGYFDINWGKMIITKIIGGTLPILGGLSLGREGPSVQIGAMASKGISRLFKSQKEDEKNYLICGAAAGLAATFNAPLAGLMFSIEELNRKLNKKLILVGIIAVFTADLVSKLIFGFNPMISFYYDTLPWNFYWLLIILGLVVGISGFIYNFTMIKTVYLWKKVKNFPIQYRITLIFLISGIVSLFIPPVLCGGEAMINILEVAMPSLTIIFILLIVKFLFSILSFSSGAPGGIFHPLLIIGCYVGAVFGLITIPMFGLSSMLVYNFIIIGMAGFFISTVRAPITGVVLAIEMTGSLECLVGMIIVVVISHYISEALKNEPIYKSLTKKFITEET